MKPKRLMGIRFIYLIIFISLFLYSTKIWAQTNIKIKYKEKNEEQVVTRIEGACKELLEKTEFIAIVTWDESGPHLVGNWGDSLRTLGIREDNIILLPAGYYYKTEENLKKNKNIQLMIASKQVQGSHDLGQGAVIYGEGEIQTEGEWAKYVREKFPWARGALVVKVKEIELHL